MISSFKCEYTQALTNGSRIKHFTNIAGVARRKIRQLEKGRNMRLIKPINPSVANVGGAQSQGAKGEE